MSPAVERARALPSSALVALARHRLQRAAGARIGAMGAAAVVMVAAVSGAVLGDESGARQDLLSVLSTAVRWLLWLGVGPLALAVAGGRGQRDRAEGVEALAVIRGHPVGDLERARLLAAVLQTALRVAVPGSLLCLALAAIEGRHPAAWLAQVVGLCGFALIMGAVVGGGAALCSRLAGRQGRRFLLAVLLIPWVLGGRVWPAEWTVPGLVDLTLGATMDLAEQVGGRP